MVHEPDEPSPGRFELFQNYPNPFNPSTRIKFHIPRQIEGGQVGSKWVTLKVYDVLGREVATLANEGKPPGTYEVIWAPNNFGSGVYFYRLESGSYVETKKLMLVR